MNNSYIPMLSLQVFADGGGDGSAAAGQGVTAGAASQQSNKGAKNPLADVKYGIQPEVAPAAEVQTAAEPEAEPNPEAEFDALIKGKYKAQYDAKMQDTIQKRLRGAKDTAQKYDALQPVLEILAKKHGVDAGDIKALAKAIEEDDSYFENEAMERGMTVKQLKEVRSMERENAELRRQMQERQTQEKANELYASWMKQAEDVKQVYPGFDMKSEMNNPKFVDLLRSNIDVRTAYEVIHKDDIIRGAMQFTAKTVESKIAKNIAANGARPSENGVGSGSPAVIKNDVTQLTRADREEIRRRVARGEKIRF